MFGLCAAAREGGGGRWRGEGTRVGGGGGGREVLSGVKCRCKRFHLPAPT